METEEDNTERTGHGTRVTSDGMSPECGPLLACIGRPETISPKFLSTAADGSATLLKRLGTRQEIDLPSAGFALVHGFRPSSV